MFDYINLSFNFNLWYPASGFFWVYFAFSPLSLLICAKRISQCKFSMMISKSELRKLCVATLLIHALFPFVMVFTLNVIIKSLKSEGNK